MNNGISEKLKTKLRGIARLDAIGEYAAFGRPDQAESVFEHFKECGDSCPSPDMLPDVYAHYSGAQVVEWIEYLEELLFKRCCEAAEMALKEGLVPEGGHFDLPEGGDTVEGFFSSVWDSGKIIITKCVYNKSTKIIEDIEISEEAPDGSLEREFILIDGEEIQVCKECHEGILEAKMVPHPVNDEDNSLYEVLICSACGEESV